MRDLFEQGWEIVSAGGATGEAFFATNKHDEKLFLKRNSSPFLAVLSAEGIVPKLIWTKRMENGDVITAQQCLNGRELTTEEMAEERVAKLLKKIHESRALLTMLARLGKAPYEPNLMLADMTSSLDAELFSDENIKASFLFLQTELPNIYFNEWAVCHGDVNHNNWLLSDQNELFLIDWDGATIADPALDLGPLLYLYVSKKDWPRWLEQYGLELTDHLEQRMKWYIIAHTVMAVQWHKNKGRLDEMRFWLEYLKSIL